GEPGGRDRDADRRRTGAAVRGLGGGARGTGGLGARRRQYPFGRLRQLARAATAVPPGRDAAAATVLRRTRRGAVCGGAVRSRRPRAARGPERRDQRGGLAAPTGVPRHRG